MGYNFPKLIPISLLAMFMLFCFICLLLRRRAQKRNDFSEVYLVSRALLSHKQAQQSFSQNKSSLEDRASSWKWPLP